jgi:hypothetical protein
MARRGVVPPKPVEVFDGAADLAATAPLRTTPIAPGMVLFGTPGGWATIEAGLAGAWAPDEALPARAVDGTAIVWRGLRGWLRAHARTRAAFRPSFHYYRRRGRLDASLGVADVRATTDREALHALLRVLDGGDLAVEVHNRLVALDRAAAGRPAREAGPAFDPSRIPTGRLERLAQRPDLDDGRLERVRAELARRRLLDAA